MLAFFPGLQVFNLILEQVSHNQKRRAEEKTGVEAVYEKEEGIVGKKIRDAVRVI